jgi:hypothetical protein
LNAKALAQSAGKPLHGIADAARKARGPALAAGATAAAFTGAALLKRRLTPNKRRKVLGVSVAAGGADLAGWLSTAGKRVAKTSQELAKLSNDVEQVGKTAQKVGDSLS